MPLGLIVSSIDVLKLRVNTDAVKNFIQNILNIQDPDYGDFMRKANLYIVDLGEQLKETPYKDVHERIKNMQSYVQFYSNWDIQSTRDRIISDTRLIDEILSGKINCKPKNELLFTLENKLIPELKSAKLIKSKYIEKNL